MLRTLRSAAALLILGSPAALAQTPTVASVAVAYDDLDLSHAAGVSSLLRRLSAASRQVCGGERPTTVSYDQLDKYLACRASAMRNAVDFIDNPAVTQAWRIQSGETSTSFAAR